MRPNDAQQHRHLTFLRGHAGSIAASERAIASTAHGHVAPVAPKSSRPRSQDIELAGQLMMKSDPLADSWAAEEDSRDAWYGIFNHTIEVGPSALC
ncbi:MAG: hypothetical protein R3A47_05580 [Polyangiales bacterium]